MLDPKRYVHALEAKTFLHELNRRGTKADLFVIDPPYYEIVDDSWDNQWASAEDYTQWLVELVRQARTLVSPHGSLIVFGGIGGHGAHPLFDVIRGIEGPYGGWGWTYRNWITWKKRRAYGKSHDYLFCREEILWYSASAERTAVTFNIPLTEQLRGYKGWDPKHPAKSEYKRVSNVWDDIHELMRPERNCQKPLPLMNRLISTHSNPGDLVVDFFAGWGSTGVSALGLGRRFVGCKAIAVDADDANARCREAASAFKAGSKKAQIAPPVG